MVTPAARRLGLHLARQVLGDRRARLASEESWAATSPAPSSARRPATARRPGRQLGSQLYVDPECCATVRHGHVTKQGSPWVRGTLQEAAQTAKRHPVFARAYGQLARRRGSHVATTAIARRLLARCFHILTQLEAQKVSEKATTGRARVCA